MVLNYSNDLPKQLYLSSHSLLVTCQEEKKKEKKQRKTRQNLEFPELSALAFCMNILSPKNLYFEMAMPYD